MLLRQTDIFLLLDDSFIVLVVSAALSASFERTGQRVDQCLATNRQQSLAAFSQSDGLALGVMPELFFGQFLGGVVPFLVAYALVDGSVAAADRLQHRFSAVEHCVELAFTPVLQKLPALLPQVAGALGGGAGFEIEGRVLVKM
jgi:hypothetical protein